MNCVQDGDKKFVYRNRRACGEKEVASKIQLILIMLINIAKDSIRPKKCWG